MESSDDTVRNKVHGTLTYAPWYEKVKDFLSEYWKALILWWFASLSGIWGAIEASSFFFPDLMLKRISVFLILLLLGLIIALVRCVIVYRKSMPKGLESESREIQIIAKNQKHFWEYELTHKLLKSRIDYIDQEIDDLMNRRIHVNVKHVMNIHEYIQWIEKRETNIKRVVSSSEKLLVYDIPKVLTEIDKDSKNEFDNTLHVFDLAKELYQSAYNYRVEGLEIKPPDGFELLHEIQFEWISVVSDGFGQMLKILSAADFREIRDYSNEIILSELPRIDEYCDELERLENLMKEQMKELD